MSLLAPPREQLPVSLSPTPGIRADAPILGGGEKPPGVGAPEDSSQRAAVLSAGRRAT